MTATGPGCVKTHTSAKCGKYNSPTRYRARCAQHDLALMMRNFSNMFLRARRALEFSHGLGQKRSLASHLFDHLVSSHLQGQRNRKPERLCGLQIDGKVELGRLHDRQVARFFAVENAAGVNTCLAI